MIGTRNQLNNLIRLPDKLNPIMEIEFVILKYFN